jgi:hypothetical protein
MWFGVRKWSDCAAICAIALMIGIIWVANSWSTSTQVQGKNCAVETIKAGNMIDRSDANFARISDCLKKMEEIVEEVQKQIAGMRGGLRKAAPAGDTVSIASNSIVCPAGSYLTSVTFQDESGLAHGALYGPVGVCSKLNTDD